MRYCGIFDPVVIGRITLRQYTLMVQAISLRLTDKERDIHAQAWLNVQAKATKQRGKKTVPYFASFDEFFKPPAEQELNTPKKQRAAKELDDLKALVLKTNLGKINISNGG